MAGEHNKKEDGEGSKREMREKWRQAAKNAVLGLAALVFVAGFVRLASAGVWRRLFLTPCRLETDCTGDGVDVEQIKQWEERAKEGSQGILDLAGWRREENRVVTSAATGRSCKAQMTAVYGNMELAFPAEVLAGSNGLAGREECCVLSGELADALFGSLDVAGEEVCFERRGQKEGGRRFIVIGVVETEGECLWLSMEEGELDGLAVLFDMRFQAKKRMESFRNGLDG